MRKVQADARALSSAVRVLSPAIEDAWLSHSHMPRLRMELSRSSGAPSAASLELRNCERLSDAAIATLFATPAGGPSLGAPGPPPPHAYLHKLHCLRVSGCRLGDGSVGALCNAAERGHLQSLHALALDHNQLLLGFEGSGHPLASRMGAALRALPLLEELDLCANETLSDEAAAVLCTSLLVSQTSSAFHEPSPPPLPPAVKQKSARRGQMPRAAATNAAAVAHAADANKTSASLSPLRVLHLGATGAGNHTATSIATALPDTQLRSLCIGSELGDRGAAELAVALPLSRTLQELWIGNKVGDMGLQHLVHALAHEACPLRLLGLGGRVRGDVVVSNRLEARAPTLLCEALRARPDGMNELRLSGNVHIGGAGCTALVRALSSCQALRELHIDGCGLDAEHVCAVIEAMNEVWCLRVLVLDPAASDGIIRARPLHHANALSIKPAHSSLLSMKQRLQLAKLLDYNRRYGRRRVDSWRLSRSLDEVAWVFNGARPSQLPRNPFAAPRNNHPPCVRECSRHEPAYGGALRALV